MHWYTPVRIEGPLPDAIASLAEVRVEFKLSTIHPTYQATDDNGHPLVMKDIGMIKLYDTGEIHALAYEGLCGAEIRVVLGSAEAAMSTKPCMKDGWDRRRNNGKPRWQHVIQIPVDEDEDKIAFLAARDLTRYAREKTAELLDDLSHATIEVSA